MVWIFNHSNYQATIPEDVPVVSKMNVNPGGKQPVMDGGVVSHRQYIMERWNASDSRQKGESTHVA